MEIRDFIGFTLAAPLYHFGDKPVLIEGAERMLALGSRTAKFFMDASKYTFNHTWPECRTLSELARTDYFRTVFHMDFKTVILETFSLESGRLGARKHEVIWPPAKSRYVSDVPVETWKQVEYDEMYEFACSLFEDYRGTGKRFILQNWESDWAVRGHFDANRDPTPESFAELAEWANVRQDAVDRARREHPDAGVEVLHCLEVNLTKIGFADGRPTVTTEVLPKTHCDMYSYSAYDTSIGVDLLPRAIDFIKEHAPASETVGRDNVMIGEYGIPENEFTHAQIDRSVQGTLRIAYEKNVPYCVYWELYDNEATDKKTGEPVDTRGFYVVKPSGKPAYICDYFKKALDGNRL